MYVIWKPNYRFVWCIEATNAMTDRDVCVPVYREKLFQVVQYVIENLIYHVTEIMVSLREWENIAYINIKVDE